MGGCKLDHSVEDVRKKLSEQSEFLPEDIIGSFQLFLKQELNQETLNESFHLLKKYDLSSKEEQSLRNIKIKQMFKSN